MAAGIRGIANEYGIQSSYEKDVILHRMRGPETEEMLRKARDRRMDVLGFIPEDPVITECDLRDTSIMAAEGHRPSVRVVHSILEEQGLLREAHVYEATGMGC